jgi:hypothetical protein
MKDRRRVTGVTTVTDVTNVVVEPLFLVRMRERLRG